MMMKSDSKSTAAVIAPVLLAALCLFGQPAAASTGDLAARVNGEAITLEEFDAAFQRAARQKLYHSTGSSQVEAVRRETLESLIVERLLMREAERRKIVPDLADIERRLTGYEDQYKNSAQWAEMRERVLPQLREKLLKDNLRAQLERQVRTVAEPTEAELKAFHQKNITFFTEPSRDHVAVILLKVDPSSPTDVWDAAKGEAARLVKQLQGGADFGELARTHSGDGSAAKGGDMGYLHRGMLPEEAQAVVDKLKPGQISEPVQMLQGIALLKLVDRSPEIVHPLDRVRDRAVQLYKRNTGEARWAEMVKKLRDAAKVEVLVSLAEPQPPAAPAAK